MTRKLDYIEINKQSWNQRTEHHLKSDFYDLEGFIKGNTSLNEIELSILGDVKDKSILHLQCHFGQDTLSLGRLGAKVTGIDLSDKAIEEAKKLSAKIGIESTFICSDVYELPKNLDEKFDIIYTSYGVITWMPDLDKWAKVISHFLKPNGKLIFVEFHPVVWMFDDNFKEVGYNYFNSGEIVEKSEGTYADKTANIQGENITWNHSLAEVLTSLLSNGLEINSFNEYDYSPYNCFNETEEFEPKKFRIKHLENKIPMVYALTATKK